MGQIASPILLSLPAPARAFQAEIACSLVSQYGPSQQHPRHPTISTVSGESVTSRSVLPQNGHGLSSAIILLYPGSYVIHLFQLLL